MTTTDIRERAAVILAPLIKEIFHGENRTSEQIHIELDKALDAIASLYTEAREGMRQECLAALPKKIELVEHDCTMTVCTHRLNAISFNDCEQMSRTAITNLV